MNFIQTPSHGAFPGSSECSFSPCGVSECDIVQLCPACKHMFLCNKAMVASSPAAFILDVHETFIGAHGFVVVVGHLLRCRFFSRTYTYIVISLSTSLI